MQTDAPTALPPQREDEGSLLPSRPAWSLAEAVALLVLYMLVQSFFMLLRAELVPGNAWLGAQLAASNATMLVLMWAFLRLRTGSTLGALRLVGLRLSMPASKTLVRCIRPTFVAVIAMTAWALAQGWWYQRTGTKPPPQQVVVWLLERWGKGAFADVGVFIAGAVVLTPVVEETVFRSLLYLPLRARIRRLPAAMLVSTLFAMIHFYPSGLGHLLILALAFTWLVEATGTLWAPIAAHALHNGLMIVLILVLEVPL